MSWAQTCRGVDWSDPEASWNALHALAQGIGDEAAAGIRLEDAAQPRNAVWHTVMAAHPHDGHLSDAQWHAIASRLMHETKLHEAGAPTILSAGSPCGTGQTPPARTIIHVMAVLVRLDGSRASIRRTTSSPRKPRQMGRAEFGLRPRTGSHLTHGTGQGVRADRPVAAPTWPRRPRSPSPTPEPPAMSRPCGTGCSRRAATGCGPGRAAPEPLCSRQPPEPSPGIPRPPSSRSRATRCGCATPRPTPDRSRAGTLSPHRTSGTFSQGVRRRALGSDCTWPALIARQCRRVRRVATRHQWSGAGNDRPARIAAAGWGAESIDR